MKQYVRSIDTLRILSILAVIAVHTTTRTLEAAKFDLVGFPLSIFINQMARFAVPLFFIISGFVLEIAYQGGINYFDYFKKRFVKIAAPFVIWSLIYYLFVYTGNNDNIIRVFLTGNASYQLYFIPTLCIFYLIFPLLHKIYKYISKWWILSIILGSQVWFLYNDYFIETYRYPDPIRITILAYFFFIIGMWASHHRDGLNEFAHKLKYILLPATVFAGIYVFWEGRGGYLATRDFMAYYSQWRPSVLIYTLLLGITFFRLFEKSHLQFSIIEKLSKLSFFVFFVHVAVIETVWKFGGKILFDFMGGILLGKILFDPLFFIVVVTISFSLAFFSRKIPHLARLVG